MSKMDDLRALQTRLDALPSPRDSDDWQELVPVEAYEEGPMGNGRDKAAIGPKPVILRPISEIVGERREPEWLIHKVIEKNVLAVLAGPRGTFKSFIALDWSMRMALDGHPGIILSGEGAGLDRRVTAWVNQHAENTDLASLPLVALERPINLNMIGEMLALREAIEALPSAPAFIVIDTYSKFSAGIDENDNGEVSGFLASLVVNLREEYRCTILIIAHTGHSDTGRPRGASALMSNPDAEYIVARPDAQAMTVTVTRERFKDTPALTPLAYEAKIIDLGRSDSYGEPITSLALLGADVPPVMSKKYLGKNQETVRTALREWVRAHPGVTVFTVLDMKDLCKAQSISRGRREEVCKAFVALRIFTPCAGSGWVINVENLA
jgi:hypothetical protein